VRKVLDDHLPYFLIITSSHPAIASAVAPPARKECGANLDSGKPHCGSWITFAMCFIIRDISLLITWVMFDPCLNAHSISVSSFEKEHISLTTCARVTIGQAGDPLAS